MPPVDKNDRFRLRISSRYIVQALIYYQSHREGCTKTDQQNFRETHRFLLSDSRASEGFAPFPWDKTLGAAYEVLLFRVWEKQSWSESEPESSVAIDLRNLIGINRD
jgi:hypothetical protein